MIDVQTAVKASFDFLHSVYNSKDLFDVRIEEAELSEDSQYWFITLGFTHGMHDTAFQAPHEKATHQRELKKFRINANTGNVLAMEIRPL